MAGEEPSTAEKAPFRVLVISKTCGYRHDSIPAGLAAIKAVAAQSKAFIVDESEDTERWMTPEFLREYAVVVLLQCTGNFLTSTQLDALRLFVRAGGGVVAIHGAAAGMLDDPWYGALIGAHFLSHPPPELGEVVIEHPDHDHVLKSGLVGKHDWMDEWYAFQTNPRENSNLKFLLKGAPASSSGVDMENYHPLSWCQEFEGGRSFFTALGHFPEAYADPWFTDQLRRAIVWAAWQHPQLTGCHS
jgi:type 1 glutamine amidotransferase